MRSQQPEYISTEIIDGQTYVVDRRIADRQPDGSMIIRDPVTHKTWNTDGTPLPDDREWTDSL